MKQPRMISRGLLVVGVVLIFSLLFANKIMTGSNSQVAGDAVTPVAPSSATITPPVGLPSLAVVTSTPLPPDFPTHVAETLTAMPTVSPTVTSILAPPACTFPLAQINIPESMPEEYSFSEPEVVLTNPDNIYNIIEWLPDNQQVLVTEDQYSTAESGKPLQQSIRLYNPETGESKVYAIRHYIAEPPAWQPKLNAVVYPVMNLLSIDENTHNLTFTRQVWVSYGEPDAAQMLADDLSQFPIAIKPGGNETIYLSDKQISKRDGSLKGVTSVPFDAIGWDYRQAASEGLPISYAMTWQPGTELIFLHSNGGMQGGGGYTYILDTNTGQVCELHLGGWAIKARWSSDGQYLAIIRAAISSSPVNLTDMVILDTITGSLYTLGVTPQEVGGKHYIDDFVWAPDNHHLLAVGSVFSSQNSSLADIAGLYLVDFMSGQSVNVLSTYKFYENMSQNNLAWSPDGSKLLIRCPTIVEDRVCLVSIQKTEQ
jgi:WD40 repeat protein